MIDKNKLFIRFFNCHFTFLLFIALSSCSTIIGNVKPVDEKSDHYSIIDLSKESKDWKRLDSSDLGQKTADQNETTDQGDITYQSVKTSAVVSVNTACRDNQKISKSLETISRQLLLGITDVTQNDQKEIKLSGVNALQTTIQGQISGEKTKIRAVVLTHQGCVYDLMYVSKPDRFAVHEADFARFISSLQLH